MWGLQLTAFNSQVEKKLKQRVDLDQQIAHYNKINDELR